MGRLFWKFFAAILFAQIAATIGIGGVFWLRDQARERAAITGVDTSPPAEIMVEASAAALTYGGPAALRDMLGNQRRRSAFVIDEAGKEMLGRPVERTMVLQAESILKLGDDRQPVRAVSASDGHRYLIFSPRDPRHGPGSGPPPEPRGSSPRGNGPPPPNATFFQVATLVVATLASLLVAFGLAWYFSRPIRALRGAFEAAASGDLAPRFGASARRGGDELSELGHDFDRMSAQLRALMEAQRRLLHDVSHELRSPLARLQAAIGLAHQQPDKLAASLERIERESVRMDKLVGELLTLSRLEASAPAMNEHLSIQELIEEIVVDASFEAEQMGRRILLTGSTEAVVRGAPDLLWRAIENVVRNAIKHSWDGGTVTIHVLRTNGSVQVRVDDRGPGVAPADLAAIFKPFFRAEASRGNVDGHGLGLAIAERVIHAHGGTIGAANRDGGGLSVTMTLPCAPIAQANGAITPSA